MNYYVHFSPPLKETAVRGRDIIALMEHMHPIIEAILPLSDTPDSTLFYPVFGIRRSLVRDTPDMQVVNDMRTPNLMLKHIIGHEKLMAFV